MSRRVIPLSFATAAVVAACAAWSGQAADAPGSAPGQGPDALLAEFGAERFERHCASCHGTDARGTGPVAQALRSPPPDLRRIAARYGGTFPDGEIARMIDGRFSITPHGPREMPVWGEVFSRGIPESGPAESIARGQVAVLVEYLKSIQDPPDGLADPESIRAKMREIFGAVRVLLPLSLSEGGFAEPENEQRVRDALAVLDRNAARLSRHGASRDVAFAHLARSLSIEARDVRLRYDEGRIDEARYLVRQLAETCAACHSRLPAGSAPVSAEFIRGVEVSSLRAEQRAQLAYATRQFDVALEAYEAKLSSPESSANDLYAGGYLFDHLELAIRVRRDRARAAAALDRFAARRDLSPALRAEVESWSRALASLPSAKPGESALSTARRLAAPSPEPMRWGESHRLIENLEASALLHLALEGNLSRRDRAEAYYLLGLIETRIGRSYWRSEAEAYLETAIRMEPGGPVAGDAYALLEEFLVAGYTGSAGTRVPPDLDRKLDRLRHLAESPIDGRG